MFPPNHYRSVIQPILKKAAEMDVATNPAPEALFDPRSGAINIWCTPQDHPAGDEWEQAASRMTSGAFAKKAEFLGSISWKRDEQDRITAILLDTEAFALHDTFPKQFRLNAYQVERLYAAGIQNAECIKNREGDLEWLADKARWLFEQAGVDLDALAIPIEVGEAG